MYTGIAVGAVVGGALVVVLIAFGVIRWNRRKRQTAAEGPPLADDPGLPDDDDADVPDDDRRILVENGKRTE